MNTIKVIVCAPGRAPEVQEIDRTLEEEQRLVGGLISIYYPLDHDDDTCIILNDEGKLLNLPPNRPLYDERGKCIDIVAGTFFIVRAPEDSDDFASLTDEQIKKYTAKYQEMVLDLGGGQYGLLRPAA